LAGERTGVADAITRRHPTDPEKPMTDTASLSPDATRGPLGAHRAQPVDTAELTLLDRVGLGLAVVMTLGPLLATALFAH
jgi:hypothetical protein